MSQHAVEVLLIEDNPGDARLIREMLVDEGVAGFNLTHVDRLSRGLELASGEGVDLILLDLSLPGSHGLETFTTLRMQSPGKPVIVLTGIDDETLAVRAVQEGAQDYLVKGRVDGTALVRSMRYAIERKKSEERLKEAASTTCQTVLKASHDIRNGIDALQATVVHLRGGEFGPCTADQQRLLDALVLQIEHLRDGINDVLDLQELHSGMVPFSFEASDLNAIFTQVAERLRSVPDAVTPAPIVLELDPALPPVRVDHAQLAQACLHLVSAAVRRSRGTPVSVRTSAGKHVVDASISYEGSKTPRDAVRIRAPEPGENLNDSADLGFAIAEEVIRAHHGRLWEESLQGRRAVHFVLPAEESGA